MGIFSSSRDPEREIIAKVQAVGNLLRATGGAINSTFVRKEATLLLKLADELEKIGW